jgi:hypothetical protein
VERLPSRIYVCPECDYRTEYRWVLKNHLQRVHGLGKRQAKYEAQENEYLANPVYLRATNNDEDLHCLERRGSSQVAISDESPISRGTSYH